ncbi:MAG: thiamine transport system permease protein [Kosmotogales bacterium]|nr:thiamine transport system permease protein [Kosmotogales bacterium]
MRFIKKNLFVFCIFLFLIIIPLTATFISISNSEIDINVNSIKNILSFTIKQAVVSTVFSFLVAFPVALYVGKYKTRLNKVLKRTSIIPFFFPSISMTVSFLAIYGRYGVINNLLNVFHIDRVQFLYTFWIIIVAHVFYNSPILVKTISEGYERYPKNLYEVSLIQGAGPIIRFFKIELPFLLSSITSGLILAFSYSFTSFAVVMILGGSQYATLEVSIYMYLKLLGKPNIAIIISIIQFAFLVLFGLLINAMDKQYTSEGPVISKKRCKNFFLKIYSSFYALFEWVPVFLAIVIPFYNFNKNEFSIDNFINVFKMDMSNIIGVKSIFNTIFNSVFFSLAAAVLSIVLSFYIIWSLKIKNQSTKILRVLSLISISISPVILSLAYSYTYPFISPVVLIILLYIVITFPVNLNFIYSFSSKFDNAIIESSKIDGANSIKIMTKIALPIFKIPLIYTLSISFAICFGEISAALVLISDSYPTLPVAIYRLSSTRYLGEARTASSLLLIIVLLVVGIISYILKKSQHEVNSHFSHKGL